MNDWESRQRAKRITMKILAEPTPGTSILWSASKARKLRLKWFKFNGNIYNTKTGLVEYKQEWQ